MPAVIDVAVRRPVDPAAQPGQPLLLFLHGFGSHEQDLAGLASFLPERFDWVSLRAPLPISASGFAWFPITTPGRPGFSLDAVLPGDEDLARLRPPIFFGRGDVDGVISAETTARIAAWLPGHSTLTEKVYPGLAHSISAEELADVSAFLDDVVPAAGS